ncbi:MAG: hypothetical protein KDC18_17870 [Alphaproteobacteria bacterium]|nr:hypothetical protein [Alphaproteobacteria bacterium]
MSEKISNIVEVTIKIGCTLLAGACILLSVWMVISEKTQTATLTFGFGVVLLFLALISRFKKFKGFGLEAELWENKQEEAEKIITLMRSQSLILSKQIIELMGSTGRFYSIRNRQMLFDASENLDRSLRNLGASDKEIDDVMHGLHYFHAIDISHLIFGEFNKIINEKINKNREKILLKFGSPIKDIDGFNSAMKLHNNLTEQRMDTKKLPLLAPNIELLEYINKKIDGASLLSEKDKNDFRNNYNEALCDLQVWIKERKLRRKEIWLSEERPIR